MSPDCWLTCFNLELDLNKAVALEGGELGAEDLLVELQQVTEVVFSHTRVPHQHVCKCKKKLLVLTNEC